MTGPTQAEIIQLNIGDTVPIGQVMTNMILMGIVTDINNPNMFAATLQAYQNQAVLTIPVLQGPQGIPGQLTFALRWQNDNLTSPSQLPTDLTNLPADLGKFWVFGVQDQNGNTIATTMYVWWGTAIGFRQLPVGAPGPPGPYPVITPIIIPEIPGSGNGPGGVDSWIAVTGPVSNPNFAFHIAAPQGVAGPSAALGSSPDVDFTTRTPQPGDILQCTNRVTPGSPTTLTALGQATGGSLTVNTYFYVVTATLPNGETMPSNEIAVSTGGSTSSVILSWLAPNSGTATGYRIYRGTSIGGENALVAVIVGGTTVTFTDTGAPTTPATPPSEGVTAGRPIWANVPMPQQFPYFYTIPESAFQSQAGITGATPITVSTFNVPPVNWPWKPYVNGQCQVFGANLSFTPLLVGMQVLLGSPTNGTLVARGFADASGYVTFIPHTSNATNPSNAITPQNSYALVPANHTGTQGTLYFQVLNIGMAGVFDFNSPNADGSVLQLPVPQ